jgi:hypothetical protein
VGTAMGEGSVEPSAEAGGPFEQSAEERGLLRLKMEFEETSFFLIVASVGDLNANGLIAIEALQDRSIRRCGRWWAVVPRSARRLRPVR